MSPRERRGLGKGLGALIPGPSSDAGDAPPGIRKVHIDAILPNPRQPRSHFDQDALLELANSIREVGLIQPLIVQQISGADAGQTAADGEMSGLIEPSRYQIIAGERRWRAARLAGLQHVEVIVKEATPQETLELALIENIQRADLNPLEEANAYLQLSQDFGLTQERIAERVSRSRESVANTLRLLRLPEVIRQGLLENKVSEGHARALLMLDDEEEQILAYRAILKKGLSVRQAEELARRLKQSTGGTPRQRSRSPDTVRLEREFRDSLGTKVDLFRSRKGGRLVIHFYSEEELQALYDRMVSD